MSRVEIAQCKKSARLQRLSAIVQKRASRNHEMSGRSDGVALITSSPCTIRSNARRIRVRYAILALTPRRAVQHRDRDSSNAVLAHFDIAQHYEASFIAFGGELGGSDVLA